MTPSLTVKLPTQTERIEESTSTPTTKHTVEPVITRTLEPTEGLIEVCPGNGDVISSLPDNFGIEGTILYTENNATKFGKGLFVLSGTPPQSAQLVSSTQQVLPYGFSPNGKWLAYGMRQIANGEKPYLETPNLILQTDSGERIERTFDVGEFESELLACCNGEGIVNLYPGYWINNELLYVIVYAGSGEEGEIFGSWPRIYDPFQGTWQAVNFYTFPGPLGFTANRFKIHEIGLSPDVTRILYPGKESMFTTVSGEDVFLGGVILENLADSKEIWSDPKFNVQEGEIIRWSPDSAYVAVANIYGKREDRKLLVISREGGVMEIANMIYPLTETHSVTELAWSPGSHYLTMVIQSLSGAFIYTFDVKTSRYINQCPIKEMGGSNPHLIWSSDEAWILITDLDMPLHIMNVRTGEVYDLLDDAIGYGWSSQILDEPP